MGKVGSVVFWIVFPITTLLVSALIVFYLDLANGPLAIFIIELILIAAFIVLRVLLRNKRFVIRMIPTIVFMVSTGLLLSFAKPSIEPKSAAYYSNPTKTEVMTLANGDVQGVLSQDKKVRIYAGIPYAKAPIGELRWKETVPVENWTGVRDCSYFAPRSMQNDNSPVISSIIDIYSAKGWYPDFNMHPLQNKSEDSLYLNIWRPNTDETNLPILVFIHGGSLTTGSSASEDYNGEEMAKTGVIMITITYRLGVFGYFAHPDLINESPNNTTGNYGLLDQIEALKWVNNNASYFGGDKNNITIAGESAGSSSVSALCVSPLAKGLFTRAIGESSSLILKAPPHTYRKMEDALKVGESVMKEFKCKNISELRKIPASELVNTASSNSSMTIDGYALTEEPYKTYLAHNNNETALLNGYNVKEADAFVIPNHLFNPITANNIKQTLESDFTKEYGDQIYNLYKDRISFDAAGVYNEIYSVYWFIYPHHCWSKYAIDNGIDVYRYQFTKFNKFHETYHAGEMIYAYGNVKKSYSFQNRYNQSDVDLSLTMLTYWSNFAKSGNPNGDNVPLWDKYIADGQVMELGSNVGKIDDKYMSLYTILDNYIDNVVLKENG